MSEEPGKIRTAIRKVGARATNNYDLRWVVGWIVLALTVFTFEMWSLLDGNDATPPLTQVTVKWVPASIAMAFIGWLAVHFGLRYINKRNEKEELLQEQMRAERDYDSEAYGES